MNKTFQSIEYTLKIFYSKGLYPLKQYHSISSENSTFISCFSEQEFALRTDTM